MAYLLKVDEHKESGMRDLHNNAYTLEVAQGVDLLAVVILAVVYDKTMDETAGERRRRDRP